jgi:hypothetical protein
VLGLVVSPPGFGVPLGPWTESSTRPTNVSGFGTLQPAKSLLMAMHTSAYSHGRVSGGLDVARGITVSMGGFEVSGSAQVAGVLATVACMEVLVGKVSVVGSANLGSICLSIRNWARLGSGLPVDLRVNLGEAASRRSLARLGSSLSFSAGCLDSWLSVEPRCRSGAIFALDVHYLLRRLVVSMGSLSR